MCFDEGDSCLDSVELLVGDQGKKLDNDKFSGIIGLAPQNDPNNKLRSFIEQVTGNNQLNPLFSFYLPKGQNG